MFDIENILGRQERPLNIELALQALAGKTVLITGAAGSIGSAVSSMLSKDINVVNTDIVDTKYRHLDVTDPRQIINVFDAVNPDIILHIAGAKHAGSGEENVAQTVDININGSINIIDIAGKYGASVVLTSTCKAVEPETVYGATKLVAERYALNNGHAVARFFNVVETSGNVFEIWSESKAPYQVASAMRYFISLREAASLVITVASIGYGRWTIDPGEAIDMTVLADKLFGFENIDLIPRRRGDRYAEPLCGMHESIKYYYDSLIKIVNAHD